MRAAACHPVALDHALELRLPWRTAIIKTASLLMIVLCLPACLGFLTWCLFTKTFHTSLARFMAKYLVFANVHGIVFPTFKKPFVADTRNLGQTSVRYFEHSLIHV